MRNEKFRFLSLGGFRTPTDKILQLSKMFTVLIQKVIVQTTAKISDIHPSKHRDI